MERSEAVEFVQVRIGVLLIVSWMAFNGYVHLQRSLNAVLSTIVYLI